MAPRFVVYGAGAVGGTIGGRLHQHGHDVVLIARGRHGAVCRSEGLLLRSADGDVRLDVPTVEVPSDLDLDPVNDIVVLAMKTQDTAAALDALSARASSDLPVVCAQNGVENERLALRRFSSVHAMCVMLPATHLEPGVVEVNSSPVSGILDVGRYPSGTDDISERIAAALTASSFSSSAIADVMRLKYAKLLRNLGNAIDAACGPSGRRSPLLAQARDEAHRCYEAAGIDFASDDEDDTRRGDLISIRPIDGAPPAGRIDVAEPGSRVRFGGSQLPQRRDRSSRPVARRGHPGERLVPTTGQPSGPGRGRARFGRHCRRRSHGRYPPLTPFREGRGRPGRLRQIPGPGGRSCHTYRRAVGRRGSTTR